MTLKKINSTLDIGDIVKNLIKEQITKVFLIVVSVMMFSGCDSILNEEPETFLSQSAVFSDRAGAESATKGIYNSLRDFSYYDRWFTAMVEMHADYVNGRGSQAPVGQYQLNAQNIGRIGSMYGAIYESINRANGVITGVPEIDMDPNFKNQLLGEARFLRALGYYNLVRLFGGVPLRTEPTEGANVDLPRASEDEVYSLVIEDLEFAENNLPASYDQSNQGRATRWAAKTLLADVYLTLERWNDSASKAKEIIDSGEFSLVEVSSSEDFHDLMFGPSVTTHSGEIFSIQYTVDIPAGWLGWMHKPAAGYSSGGVFAWWGELQSFIGQGEWATEDSPDLRRNAFLYSGDETQYLDPTINMLFSKFRGSPGDQGVDMPIMRYAEVLFIYAESISQANNGPNSEAYEAVNMIRRRAYGVDLNSSNPDVDLPMGLSAQAFRDAVILERGKEFIMERKRWFDLLRTDTALEIIQGFGKPIAEKNLKWPIPAEEIENNGALSPSDQNPGW
ncbi:RagB/SusD family nutrient uptake outer membrane protein [Rhodohalobacter sulfatireducens]|uniref:RagB/SusD family nutrient uptake outer membrane protein n=1 Tax=Rhodohalobacter sulfatireducens TaxID=2911366 RepID=A0ABS9KJG3_9BACT|nr:RagB/SusD family nutrient uptake outer membrane protein [Rhodohalobacter sulfatireducens]MCG2590932.1 RagB/SusD family nutrient uptake outer membrane protein [Rhodohalobacter sulfatireducens]